MLTKVVNYFIPYKSTLSVDELRSSRILVKFLLITTVLNFLYITNAVSVGFHPMEYVLLVNGLVTLLAVFMFKSGVSRVFCANLHLLNQAAGVFIAIWYGGGIESPSAIGVLLLPVTSLLLAGRKSSITWLVLSIAVLMFIYWFENSVGNLPVTYDSAQSTSNLLASLAGIMIFLFIISLVFDIEKSNALKSLIQTNEELTNTQVKIVAQRDQLSEAILELNSAQKQLIQSEKMASLGELTAGIAHEIQNPLNFVNNFAEVNTELLEEMDQEIAKGDVEEVKEIARHIKENSEKIFHHGKRADSIVKGMLQHSRSSAGVKTPTDINALADEYLRLSYHGLRAKDKSFNATFKTSLDPSIGKVDIIPDEFGRVLLNLFNNAFYSVKEKKKELTVGFEPQVELTTKKMDGKVIVTVRDNGKGISQKVIDKIYQPFFTTKPTAEGTGLGLSLSYDIVTKVHGGELKVETKDGEFAEFIIQLPV